MADPEPLERLAELIRVKNLADDEIAALIGRPCQIGHAGEWIAARVFDVALHESAVTAASDGVFRSGPLAGRSVNVKWYGLEESLLAVHPGVGPDVYLVMTGPRSALLSSRGRARPWVISSVYLFEHEPLVADLTGRGLKLGVAASVRRALWEAAEVYPASRSPLLRLCDEQRRLLNLFQAESGVVARSLETRKT
jgi:hypothetical protein